MVVALDHPAVGDDDAGIETHAVADCAGVLDRPGVDNRSQAVVGKDDVTQAADQPAVGDGTAAVEPNRGAAGTRDRPVISDGTFADVDKHDVGPAANHT